MFKLQLICITVLIIQLNQALHVNLLNKLEIFKNNQPVVDEKGSYYILNEHFSKTIVVQELFGSKILRNFHFETIFRNPNNDMFNLVNLDKGRNFNLIITLINDENNPKINVTINGISNVFKSDWLIDGRWHKIFLSYSKGNLHLWQDCKLRDNESNSKLIEYIDLGRSDLIQAQFGDENLDPTKNFNVKTIRLSSGPEEIIYVVCHDMPSRNLFGDEKLN